MESADAACRWLCAPHAKVSCHYLVDELGNITQMVGEEMRAWHAGVSYWAGERDINSHSVGIEIHNQGHSHGYPDFPEEQMRAVIALSQDIVTRHQISPDRVLAHSDVAPRRKIDPGEKFDWRRLHESGVGLWVMPVPADDPAIPTLNDTATIRELQRRLGLYGYGIDETGELDSQTSIVIKAFQRHFRPERVDGIPDRSTIATLDRLLAKRGTG
jgi:N-acetylmuramoyl-L-alanine amidase